MAKKVFFHYRESEIRNKTTFDSLNPWHFRSDGDEANEQFRKIPALSQEQLREFVDTVCDGVFAVDEETRQYASHDTIVVPRALDETKFDFIGPADRSIPVIVHAPSRTSVKARNLLSKPLKI
ncbi:MAG: hypothetical protein AB3N12_02845 [Ruegeria sp.]